METMKVLLLQKNNNNQEGKSIMRKYLSLTVLIILGVLIASCSDNSTNPPVVEDTGSILINSSPDSAQIFVDGSNTSKFTPDSVSNLSVGDHSVTLKLSGYRDTTITVPVVANQQTSKFVNLVSTLSVTNYGPKRIYESADPSASDPSGLDLSTGNAIAISTSDSIYADIYYSSSGYLVQSASLNSHMHRETFFRVGSGSNLSDGNDSPIYPLDGPWNTSIGDRESNYVFLYDDDGNYSKLIISNFGGGTPGNPAWVELTWIYNNTGADNRF